MLELKGPGRQFGVGRLRVLEEISGRMGRRTGFFGLRWGLSGGIERCGGTGERSGTHVIFCKNTGRTRGRGEAGRKDQATAVTTWLLEGSYYCTRHVQREQSFAGNTIATGRPDSVTLGDGFGNFASSRWLCRAVIGLDTFFPGRVVCPKYFLCTRAGESILMGTEL